MENVILIHLLQKQLTPAEIVQLTSYLLVARFRKIKDLKNLFQGSTDFLYLLVSANLSRLNIPFEANAWRDFFEKAQMAQGIDPTAKQHLLRFESTQALLDKEPTPSQINEAQQLSVALSRILVNIKAAQAQTTKPFQERGDDVVALLLPLYHEFQKGSEFHPKLTLKFLINFLDFSLKELNNAEQEKTIRNLLKRGHTLQTLTRALTEQNQFYEPIVVAPQLKKILSQASQASGTLYKEKVRPLQQRTSQCRTVLLHLAALFPESSDIYQLLNKQADDLLSSSDKLEQAIGAPNFSLSLLDTYANIARKQIDSCMHGFVNKAIGDKMPLHWFILNPSSAQEKCIGILLEEGADPRFEIATYKRTIKQRWQDSRKAFKHLWITPTRDATALAALLGQATIAEMLMLQATKLGHQPQPVELPSNIIELAITKGFLPAFATSFKPEDSDLSMHEPIPQRTITMP